MRYPKILLMGGLFVWLFLPSYHAISQEQDSNIKRRVAAQLEGLFKMSPLNVFWVEVLDSQIFKPYQLINVAVENPRNGKILLDKQILPGAFGSTGIFAWKDEDLIYLTGADSGFPELLKKSQFSWTQPPKADTFVKVFNQVYGKGSVLIDSKDLLKEEKAGSHSSEIQLNREKFQKLTKIIKPPFWTDNGSSVLLTYYTLSDVGLHGGKGKVFRDTISFDKGNNQFQIDRAMIEENVFDKYPLIQI